MILEHSSKTLIGYQSEVKSLVGFLNPTPDIHVLASFRNLSLGPEHKTTKKLAQMFLMHSQVGTTDLRHENVSISLISQLSPIVCPRILEKRR